MAFTVDYSTDLGKVRLLVGDTDSSVPIFQDEAVQAFLDLNGDNVKLAAAQALESIAANEVYVQKRIKALDLSTDGPAEADALRKLAASLRAQASEDEDDYTGLFGSAEMVINHQQYLDRLYKESQRSG